MNDKESLLGRHKCKYSSSILGVERGDLPQSFDFQCVYLAYLKYMMSQSIKMHDFHIHQFVFQGLMLKLKVHETLNILVTIAIQLWEFVTNFKEIQKYETTSVTSQFHFSSF